MSYQDIVLEIKQLPLDEQVSLLEVLAHSIREELAPPTPIRLSSLNRVRGLLKPDGPLPTDDELSELSVT